MELGSIKLTWTEIGTRYGKRLFLCDQIVKFMPFGETQDYETSDVRKWLNNDFLKLFSEEEKAKIEPFSMTDRGDKFFLLSAEEYEKCEASIRYVEGCWWLRTPSNYEDVVHCVRDTDGIGFRYVYRRYVGVRPACLMD